MVSCPRLIAACNTCVVDHLFVPTCNNAKFRRIMEFQDTFMIADRVVHGENSPRSCLTLHPRLMQPTATISDRTNAVATVMAALRDRGGVLTRWYNEFFPVVISFGAEPAFLLERGAYTLLGIRGPVSCHI